MEEDGRVEGSMVVYRVSGDSELGNGGDEFRGGDLGIV